jgi:hypothetical protein
MELCLHAPTYHQGLVLTYRDKFTITFYPSKSEKGMLNRNACTVNTFLGTLGTIKKGRDFLAILLTFIDSASWLTCSPADCSSH